MAGLAPGYNPDRPRQPRLVAPAANGKTKRID
jgi:hypothetical protein